MDSYLALEGAIEDLTSVLEIELSVWVDGLIRSLSVTTRPHHMYTTVVVREDIVAYSNLRHSLLTH